MEAKDIITVSLAAYGAALSSFLAFMNWRDRRSGAKVEASLGFQVHGAMTSETKVIVTASNPRSRPVTVTGMGIRFPNGKSVITMGEYQHSMPRRLDEGESTSCYLSLAEVQRHLQAEGYKPGTKVRGFCRDATGRLFLGPSLSIS